MKRTFAFMMALGLVFSLAATAFAAPGTDGSITITNTTKDKNYWVYKIFEATYDNDSDSVTYTINGSNQFFNLLFGATAVDTVDQENDYFKYYAETGVVTKKDGVENDALFGYLEGLLTHATPTAEDTAEGTSLTFSGLTYGYYVIKREDGKDNAVTITNVNKHADVIDKNVLPGGDIDKEADRDTAAVGETITWTVEFTALNYDGDKKVKSYTFKDTLTPDDWAAIDTSSIVITVNGEEIDKDEEWTLTVDTTSHFEVEIPWMDDEGNFIYSGSSKIVVTYNATVLEAATDIGSVNKNKAEADWEYENGDTPPDVPSDETETDVFNMGFTKVDGTDNTKTLANAKFKLYGAYDADTKVYSNPVNVDLVSAGVYMYNEEGTSNEVVTPEGGQVVILGLPAGTYYLEETEAPAGYNKLNTAQAVVVGAKDSEGNLAVERTVTIGETQYIVNNVVLNIENFSGVELPSTGGEGTIMMITFGTMVALAFAVLMITQKKMSIYQD